MSGTVEVRLHRRWDDVPVAWHALARAGAATPFQTPAFLAAWYETIAQRPGVQPLIVEALDRTGAPVVLLPLIRRARPSRIGFMDEGLDNGAPILGPAAPEDRSGAEALWRALRSALPAADLIELARMPRRLGGRANPFVLLPGARPSRLNAHVIALPDSWEEYDGSRSKHFRKEQRRVARVFERHPGAAFTLAHSPEERSKVLAALERLQRARLLARGVDYRLDRPDIAEFYRRLVADGAADGSAILTALSAGGEIIAALLAVSDGTTVTAVRVGHAGGEWSKASPGRLLFEKTIAAMHARGIRRFDLSIGDHPYKDAFAVATEPLFELVEPLRLAGWPAALRARAKARLGASPALRALAARLRGPPARPQSERAQGPT